MGASTRPESASVRDAVRVEAFVSRVRGVPRALSLGVLAALAAAASGVLGGPAGGQVVAGSAEILRTSSQRTDVIQSSPRAVIDWRSFSIGAAEHVDFQQPSARAAVLNRVTGSERSALLGRLTANGQVFLVNPNGVFIGPGARIDTASFLATTTNVATADFMKERLQFDDVVNPQGVIVNQGEINAADGGLVALVAPGVENAGVIRARLGRVVLASGNRFALDLYGDELVHFAVDEAAIGGLQDAQGRSLRSRVRQAGRIEADGGEVRLTASAARSVVDDAINMSGHVRAATVGREGGEIVLRGPDDGRVAVSGTLSVTGAGQGQRGGRAAVTGGELHLAGSAMIDASGDAGGGEVRVGGDYRGEGRLARSRKTAVAAGATLRADATGAGNGGSIVVWSDGETRYEGRASARGGSAGGDGGLVEVSGRQTLIHQGKADAAAPAGRAGRLLLDPAFQVVDEGLALAIGDTLGTGTGVELQADLDIVVQAAISGLVEGGIPGAALSLSAGRDILARNHVLTDGGAIALTAGRDITMSEVGGLPAYLYAGTAPIALVAGGNVTARHLLTSGAVSVSSTGGAITLAEDLAHLAGSAGIGSLAILSQGDATLAGVRSAGAVDVRSVAGNVRLDGAVVTGGAASIRAGGDLRVTSGVWSGGEASLSAADGGIAIAESAEVSGRGLDLSAGAGGIAMAAGSVLRAAGEDIALAAAGPVSVRHLDTTGRVTIGTAASPIGGTLTLLEDIGALAKNYHGSLSDVADLVDSTASPMALSLSAASVRLEGGVAVTNLLSITSTSGVVEAVSPLRTGAQGVPTVDANLLVAGGGLQVRSAGSAALLQPVIVTGQGAAPTGQPAPVLVEAQGSVSVPELTSNRRDVLLRSTGGDLAAGVVGTNGGSGGVTLEGVGVSAARIRADGPVTLSGERVVVGTGGIFADGAVAITGETTLAGDLETRQREIRIRSEAGGVLKPLTVDLLASPIELRFWATGVFDPDALNQAAVMAALPLGHPEPGEMYYEDANAVYAQALPRLQEWYAMLSGQWLDLSRFDVSLSRGRTLSTFAGRSDFSAADPGTAVNIEASGISLTTRAAAETTAVVPKINGILNLVADRVILQGSSSTVSGTSGDPVTLALRRAQEQPDPALTTLGVAPASSPLVFARVTLSQESAAGIAVAFDTHLGNGGVLLPFPAGWASGSLDVTGVGGLSESQLASRLPGEPPGRPYSVAKESGGTLGPPPRSFTASPGGGDGSVAGLALGTTRRVPTRPAPPPNTGGPAPVKAPRNVQASLQAGLAPESGPGDDDRLDEKDTALVGGRGVAAVADLGLDSPGDGAAANVFANGHHVATGPTGDPYFAADPFAQADEPGGADEEDEAD